MILMSPENNSKAKHNLAICGERWEKRKERRVGKMDGWLEEWMNRCTDGKIGKQTGRWMGCYIDMWVS